MKPEFPLDWLEREGPHPEMVVSTRVRLARNLKSVRFPSRAGPAEREGLLVTVRSAAEAIEDEQIACCRLDSVPEVLRTWLVERQLASAELAGVGPGSAVGHAAAVLATSRWGVLCNEEDHLRIFAIVPGLALEAAWQAAGQAERELGQRISFAFHPGFGYLTACP
ncbi:MAG TPA: hypothetical protein PLL69_09625, partial [Gemmatimonadales bacterium]|nr:hypothetical protein [Gemmatimonadales bacterium]